MRSLWSGALWVSLFLAACGEPGGDKGPGGEGDFDNFPPLSDLDPLYDGWPGNDKLPDEGKADEVFPAKFDGPMAWQSPIRSQGSRGVCSIFSALGLMEHLYIKEGTLTTPDFSEQFLQWSVKKEVGSFLTSEGSSSQYNLEALSTYGVVEEAVDPYESAPWGTTNDPLCTGTTRPVQCYTNGDPSAEALAAPRFRLPRGRWMSSRRDSIKAHMVRTNEGVVVGGTFFYQAWNHGSSTLPTDRALFSEGFVTYPNAADVTASRAKPAGHSFVLLGWDDALEIQARDGEGNPLTDANGPVMERGFFLFRNSWGTGSFGTLNDYGAGYGWISMDYVEDHLTAHVSSLPVIDFAEICGDSVDNDFDRVVDCDDEDCDSDGACVEGTKVIHTFEGPVSIPDNTPAGVLTELDVVQDGVIQSLSVTVDITHTYSGDLEVALVRGAEVVVLQNKIGGSQDDLKKTFVVPNFVGTEASGRYGLRVIDHASQDTGKVNKWSLEITTGGASNIDVFESTTDVVIPDNDPVGAFSNIEVTGPGPLTSLKAVVNIDHDPQGDLTVRLQRLGLPGEVTLVQATGSSGQFGTQSFVVPDFVGQDAAGTWRLVMVDGAAANVGTLLGWSLEIGR